MLFATLTLWLLAIVFAAWGVHDLWSRLIKPRAVNTVLLPGTLVAQLGHVLGLLVTGNSVQNAALMGDDEKGEPQAAPPERHPLPVVGPIVTALLPLLACGLGIGLAAHYLGGDFLATRGAVDLLPQQLPLSLAAVFEQSRQLITLAESLLVGILHSNLTHWPTALFLYLAVCLTVRMAPFEDNRRGAIGAILLSGLVIGLAGTFIPAVGTFVREQSWAVVSFAVSMLVLLLLASLVVNAIVGLIRVLAGKS